MNKTTVIIPNFNGKAYLKACLLSLQKQKGITFDAIVVDNGSTDGSPQMVKEEFPGVQLISLGRNTGFCTAVNRGIEKAETPYIILLNNDTRAEEHYVLEMTRAIERDQKIFSVSAKMLSMKEPDKIDDAGDYYCALGWAYAGGKGRPADQYCMEKNIFASCGGAAIYRKCIFEEIGRFDEVHFAYLEDIDIGYRAKIYGYKNIFCPAGMVYHAGSGTSGSKHNTFKVSLSSRNSIYLLYKNMPFIQLLLNLPLLIAGFMIKILFFMCKGFGKEYVGGLLKGLSFSFTEKAHEHKVKFQRKHLLNYCRIQWELWENALLIYLR